MKKEKLLVSSLIALSILFGSSTLAIAAPSGEQPAGKPFQAIWEAIYDLQDGAVALKDEVATLRDKVKAIQDEIAALVVRVSGLETWKSGIDSWKTSVESRLADLDKKITDEVVRIEGRIDGVIARVTNLESWKTTIDFWKTSVESRIATLESGVASLWTAIEKIELTPGPPGPKGDKGDKGDPGPQGVGIKPITCPSGQAIVEIKADGTPICALISFSGNLSYFDYAISCTGPQYGNCSAQCNAGDILISGGSGTGIQCWAGDCGGYQCPGPVSCSGTCRHYFIQ